MPTRLFTSTFRHSTVLVERIGALDLPATLRAEAARVVAAHEHLARAATEVTVAKGNDASLRRALRDAMAALDAQVDGLASDLVGARLGARTAPFAGFGLRGARVRGGAQRKLDRVGELLDRIGSRDAAALARAIASTRAAEQSLREVLASVTLAKATLGRRVASRDEAARVSQAAIARLRHAAALAWEGQHARQRELVGAAPRLRLVAKRRPRAPSLHASATPGRRVDIEKGHARVAS